MTPPHLPGEHVVFETHGLDTQLNDRSGLTVLIVRPITPPEIDDEAGPMYEVRLRDGTSWQAFQDELTPSQHDID